MGFPFSLSLDSFLPRFGESGLSLDEGMDATNTAAPPPCVPLFSLSATLVVECYSCPWVLVYFLGACVLLGCLFAFGVLDYLLGACLLVECWSTCWVLVHLFGAGLPVVFSADYNKCSSD